MPRAGGHGLQADALASVAQLDENGADPEGWLMGGSESRSPEKVRCHHSRKALHVGRAARRVSIARPALPPPPS